MISTKITELQLRAMLDRWYEAENTAAEEQAIIEWFAAVPESHVPADLLTDRQIFLAMHVPPVTPSAASRAIDRAICADVHFSSRRRSRFMLWGAAVMLAVVSGIALLHVVNRQDAVREPQLVASVKSVTSAQPQDEVKAPPASEPPAKVHVPERAVAPEVSTHSTVQQSPNLDAYGYRIVDVREASEILERTLFLADNSLNSGRGALREVEEATDRVTQAVLEADDEVNETLDITSDLINTFII